MRGDVHSSKLIISLPIINPQVFTTKEKIEYNKDP